MSAFTPAQLDLARRLVRSARHIEEALEAMRRAMEGIRGGREYEHHMESARTSIELAAQDIAPVERGTPP